MRLTALLWLCLSFTALAAPDGNPDQDSVNWSSLKQAMYSLLPYYDTKSNG